jgi:predicted hydrocarbon binding protein
VVKEVSKGYETALPSYEELLLRSMLESGSGRMVTEYATLFSSALTSLSKGMRELHYKSGMPIGRALYRIYERKKNYRWYEESVLDLVEFFERAGYKRITYRVFPEGVEITLHRLGGPHLGTNVHAFEAGIMSGYLTAAKHDFVHVNELLCTNNSAEFCRFVSSKTRAGEGTDPHAAEKLFDYMGEHASSIEKIAATKERVPEEYYLLSALMLMQKSYSSDMGRIMMRMGVLLGSRISVTKANAEKLVSILGLGDLHISSLRPLKADVDYVGLRAREEFVGMSVQFLDGLLGSRIGKNSTVEVTATAKANRYNVRLTEKTTHR